MAQVLAGFAHEAQELCQRVTLELLELERKEPGSEEMARGYSDLARALHTLKGSAAALGLEGPAALGHQLEERISQPKRELVRPPKSLVDEMLAGLDRFLNLLSGPGPAGDSESQPVHRPALVASSVTVSDDLPAEDMAQWRVDAREVGALIREVDRLREIRLRVAERHREAEAVLRVMDGAGQGPALDETREQLRTQVGLLGADSEALAELLRRMERGVKAVSAIPVRAILDPLHRTVHDLCRATGKEARLSLVGAEVRLDRRVLEAIRGPLVHLIRNAVDHGIEKPEARLQRGKPREGAVMVRVEQRGSSLVLEVGDDGGGIDRERVKQVALERNLYPRGALRTMSDAQVTRLIFDSGLSTRAEVTELSGRGVGLDAVKSEITALRGEVEVESVLHQGTRFIVTVPIFPAR